MDTQITQVEGKEASIEKAGESILKLVDLRFLLFKKDADTTLEDARLIRVNDPESYLSAGQFLKGIKTKIKERKKDFSPEKDFFNKCHKAVCAKENDVVDTLEAAVKVVSQPMLTWDEEQERLRKQKEAQILKENTAKEEQQRLDLAATLEQAGDIAGAEQALNTPLPTAPVVLQDETPKVEGLSKRKRWTFEVVNPNMVTREFCSPDDKKIRAEVNKLEGAAIGKIPGVRVYEDSSFAG